MVLAKPKPGLEECLRFLRRHTDQIQVVIGQRGDPFPSEVGRAWEGECVISYLSPWILPPDILRKATVAAMNFHPGPPEYPGIGCTNFALYHGEKEYGVTAHRMVEKVDSGPLIAVRRFPILPGETVLSLTRRCYEHLQILVEQVMGRFFTTGRIPRTEEGWSRRPYTRRELNDLCEIRPGMSPEEVERRIRATTYPGRPGPYLNLYGHRFEQVPSEGGFQMNPSLKGNYQLPEEEPSGRKGEDLPDLSQEFEQRALERLGGSIAFVLKKGTLVWDGEKAKTPQKG